MLEDLNMWLAVAIGLLAVGNPLHTYISARGKANAAQIDQLVAALAETNGRVSVLEATHRQLPSHGDLSAIRGEVTTVGNGVSELKGEIRAVRGTLDNIHQVLLTERN